MPAHRIVLVRHGATEWSNLGRHTGRTDLPLLADGEDGARRIGPVLAGLGPFTAVRTSPLLRARRTCELAGFGAVARVDDDLVEWDYGDDEGRTKDQIWADHPDWQLWRDGPHGGEPLAALAARADRALARCNVDHGSTLLFAHGHLLRVLAVRWLGLDPGWGGLFQLDPTTVSILGWKDGLPALQVWNAPPALVAPG